MNLVDRIADVLHEWRGVALSHAQIRAQMAEDIAEVVHPRIETVEQLRDLPSRSIVRAGDDIWERHSVGWDNLSEDGNGPVRGSKDIPLPATLLWTPGGTE